MRTFVRKCPKGTPIRDARVAAGLATKQLAGKVCVSIGALGNWERGHLFPHPRTAKRLVRALPGLTLDAIYADL